MANTVSFQESDHNDWHVITAIGRIDTVTAAESEKYCLGVLSGRQKLAMDMSALNYISSAGLRVLLRLAKREKKKFALFGVSGMIKEVLESSGIDLLLTIYGAASELP